MPTQDDTEYPDWVTKKKAPTLWLCPTCKIVISDKRKAWEHKFNVDHSLQVVKYSPGSSRKALYQKLKEKGCLQGLNRRHTCS